MAGSLGAKVYYNEIDRAKAAWLRHLIEEGEIAHGVVDERSIAEVQPDDLRGFSQHHFFAGIGVWSYALRQSGWPDDEPIWTGSCPCGPFSNAGLQKGFEDPRHLWPKWFRLVGVCRPHRIFGEQVDAADAWIDLVQTDLENHDYAFGSPDLPAAGFGGAHERQRFVWVADAHNAEWWAERAPWNDGLWPQTGRVQSDRDPGERRVVGWLGNGDHERGNGRSTLAREAGRREPADAGSPQRMGEPIRSGLSDAQLGVIRRSGWRPEGGAAVQPGDPSRPGVDWLFCRDSKWRPVEPGTCPLVDEAPARMGLLRGYGDAIDAETLIEFISAFRDVAP